MARLVIDRWECNYLSKHQDKWVLVYGRRKTGKTWLLRNCVDWSLYATATRSGECIVEDEKGELEVVEINECMKDITRRLKHVNEKAIILDEFQRVPVKYWDVIAVAAQDSERNLIICGSSLGIALRVFDRRSPLLGLFEAFRVDLASVADTITSLYNWKLGEEEEAVLWAVVLRDPWIIRHLAPRGEPWTKIAEKAVTLFPAVKGLIGEVFVEEERQLSRVYEATLKLLAEGYWRAGDIAAKLYNAGLVKTPQPGNATGVLKVLETLGLVERIPLWRTRGARTYYRHRSPITSILYNVSDIVEEIGVNPSPERIKTLYGLEFQFTIAEFLAERHRLRKGYSIPVGGRDIDVVLLDEKNSPLWGYEVKIGSITGREALEASLWIRKQGIPRTGIVALKGVEDEREKLASIDETWDAGKIVEEAKRLSKKRKTMV